tara:strand:+ start:11417 stop:11779 length:363 start_codon:yes stop_codon:yes gene_type:complete
MKNDIAELDIRQFKLMNGENVIALMISTNEHNYIVERPIAIHPAGSGTYEFSPWFPLSSAQVYPLTKVNIISHCEVDDNVKITYIKYALSDRPNIDISSIEEKITNDTDDNSPIDTITIH